MNKDLICTTAAVLCNSAIGIANLFIEKALSESQSPVKDFLSSFLWSTIFHTLPAIAITYIDSYVHKPFVTNEFGQYGLLACESLITSVGITKIMISGDSGIGDFWYNGLGEITLYCDLRFNYLNILIQAGFFKYAYENDLSFPEIDCDIFS